MSFKGFFSNAGKYEDTLATLAVSEPCYVLGEKSEHAGMVLTYLCTFL